MGGDPVNTIDPSGGSILYCPGTSALTIFFDKAFQALIKASPILGKISIGLTIGKTAAFITNMAETAAMINGQLKTMMAGDIHFTPGGQKMYFPDDNPELFKGESVKVGNLSIQPMSGSVHAFTITGEHARDGAVRFVAMFDKTSGRFTGYSWDKDLSYTYDDYIKAATEDYLRNLEHEDDPMWDPDVSEEQAAKNALNLGLSVVLPTPILKTATVGANAAKVGGLKPLGLGSTGRTAALNLVEQTAMKNIMANPQLGTRIMEGMKDSRWFGWTKMEYKVKTSEGVNAIIHFVGKWENGVLKAVDDFKFK